MAGYYVTPDIVTDVIIPRINKLAIRIFKVASQKTSQVLKRHMAINNYCMRQEGTKNMHEYYLE